MTQDNQTITADERLREAATKALEWMLWAELQMEIEWGWSRSIEQLEADGDLSKEIITLRAALNQGQG